MIITEIKIKESIDPFGQPTGLNIQKKNMRHTAVSKDLISYAHFHSLIKNTKRRSFFPYL